MIKDCDNQTIENLNKRVEKLENKVENSLFDIAKSLIATHKKLDDFMKIKKQNPLIEVFK